MKTILLILSVFTIISIKAQYILIDDNGNSISDGVTVTVLYDNTVSSPEAVFDVNVHSTNTNNFRFEIVSTNQGENANNWFCTNFGLCYPPTVTDIEVELLDDNTRELQLHYSPNGHTEDATVNYRITEVGNTNSTINFSVKYVGTATSVWEYQINKKSFFAYPNPANEYAQIKYDLNEDAKIYIYNIIGEIVGQFKINDRRGQVKFETKDLKEGTYLYQVITKSNKRLSKSLIINH